MRYFRELQVGSVLFAVVLLPGALPKRVDARFVLAFGTDLIGVALTALRVLIVRSINPAERAPLTGPPAQVRSRRYYIIIIS